MLYVCEFDEKRDYAPTTPGLDIDMAIAMESGVVFDTGVLGDYNDIDDPTSIRCRVNDAFEAIDAQRQMFKQARSVVSARESAPAVNPSEGKTE